MKECTQAYKENKPTKKGSSVHKKRLRLCKIMPIG